MWGWLIGGAIVALLNVGNMRWGGEVDILFRTYIAISVVRCSLVSCGAWAG